MSACFDSGHAIYNRFYAVFDHSTGYVLAVLSIEPVSVFDGGVDWAGEGLGPLDVGGIVVRMGDYYGVKAA